jgi:hypothetical protein
VVLASGPLVDLPSDPRRFCPPDTKRLHLCPQLRMIGYGTPRRTSQGFRINNLNFRRFQSQPAFPKTTPALFYGDLKAGGQLYIDPT